MLWSFYIKQEQSKIAKRFSLGAKPCQFLQDKQFSLLKRPTYA